MKVKKASAPTYDCAHCPAFCCSVYPRVKVLKSDLHRMAKHYGISLDDAEKRFTKRLDGERVLRRRKDLLLGESCKFLDPVTRGCTIYEARPGTCREYPNTPRCAYYDLMKFEEGQQARTGRVIPLVQITFPDDD